MGCFYTDRPVDYEMVTSFSREQMEVIAPLEHERWIREQISMGWIKGDLYEWTTDWSDFFDDGHEWYGACCWSVYDKTMNRYVVMLVSATD